MSPQTTVEVDLRVAPTEEEPGLKGRSCRGMPENVRLLVVDDYESILDVMQRVLSSVGIVDTAGSGREGLERIRRVDYDLVITDVDMPEMDGVEFYRQAWQRRPELRDRFLFFTGFPSPGSLAFFQDHRLPYLTKPARPFEVENAVAALVRKTRGCSTQKKDQARVSGMMARHPS